MLKFAALRSSVWESQEASDLWPLFRLPAFNHGIFIHYTFIWEALSLKWLLPHWTNNFLLLTGTNSSAMWCGDWAGLCKMLLCCFKEPKDSRASKAGEEDSYSKGAPSAQRCSNSWAKTCRKEAAPLPKEEKRLIKQRSREDSLKLLHQQPITSNSSSDSYRQLLQTQQPIRNKSSSNQPVPGETDIVQLSQQLKQSGEEHLLFIDDHQSPFRIASRLSDGNPDEFSSSPERTEDLLFLGVDYNGTERRGEFS